MAISYWNRIWWSAVQDPEDFSSADAGWFDIVNGAGGITGLAGLGELFFIFQEKCYTVYQYQAGDEPLGFLKTVWHGCNSERTIVEIDGYLYYLSDVGEIRRTNGVSDISLSDSIKPLTNTILNNRTVKTYYSTAPNTIPHAFFDKYNNAYRLFYAGTSTNVDKCLSYFIDKGIWTTASSTEFLASAPVFGYEDYISIMGNSSADGKTYYLVPKYADGSKVGTLDLGWLSTGNPRKQIKIYSIEIWYHAEPGESTPTGDCDTTITVTMYNDPTTNTALGTYTTTLAYNSVADNLQKKVIKTPCVGYYVRPVITDSGTTANYSIDRVIIDYDVLDSSN